MSELRFNMKPATIETFASIWWSKTFHNARSAIAELREDQLTFALRDLGKAQAGVLVLFDVFHPKAHVASKAVERVERIVLQRMLRRRQ